LTPQYENPKCQITYGLVLTKRIFARIPRYGQAGSASLATSGPLSLAPDAPRRYLGGPRVARGASGSGRADALGPLSPDTSKVAGMWNCFIKKIKQHLGFEDVATSGFDSVISHVHWV
jgi:hypothetical protein